jgi:hypothetical protein
MPLITNRNNQYQWVEEGSEKANALAAVDIEPVSLPEPAAEKKKALVEKTDVAKGPRPVGRPPHRPTDFTRKMVISAIGMGIEQTAISKLMDIAPKTLRRFYRSELDTGVARANFKVARSLYGRASGGKDTIASIFWLKARAGWEDRQRVQHEGLPEKITVSFMLEPPEKEAKMIDITPIEQGD